MAYIGQSPSIGNFQVCDAISTVNGQATYNLTVSSVAVTPETANHVLCSVNGVLQKPGTSFTIVNSTIVFSANLVTNDVVDFVHILGSVLDLGVPSDDTVATAKISANAVTGAKLNTDVISAQTALAAAPADTDEFLISDAGVLKRIDYSLIKGGGMWEFISTTTVSSAVAQVDFTTLSTDYVDFCVAISGFHNASDNTELYFRFFDHQGNIKPDTVYQWSFDGSDTGAVQVDSQGDTLIRLGRPLGAAATENASLELIAYNVHDVNDGKNITFTSSYFDASGQFGQVDGGGHYVSDAGSGTFKVTGMRFYQQSGNIAAGKFALYGRKLA